jgi:hypothetical protein
MYVCTHVEYISCAQGTNTCTNLRPGHVIVNPHTDHKQRDRITTHGHVIVNPHTDFQAAWPNYYLRSRDSQFISSVTELLLTFLFHGQVTCKASFLEIYNENVTDLLSDKANSITIRDDPRKWEHAHIRTMCLPICMCVYDIHIYMHTCIYI